MSHLQRKGNVTATAAPFVILILSKDHHDEAVCNVVEIVGRLHDEVVDDKCADLSIQLKYCTKCRYYFLSR